MWWCWYYGYDLENSMGQFGLVDEAYWMMKIYAREDHSLVMVVNHQPLKPKLLA